MAVFPHSRGRRKGQGTSEMVAVFRLLIGGVVTSEVIHQYRCRRALDDAKAKFRPACSGERVVVLGGGVAGLTAAHELAEAGMEVTVVERRHGVAMETSAANAGTLNYTARTLVASPQTIKFALGKMWHSLVGEKPERQEEAVEHLKHHETQDHQQGKEKEQQMGEGGGTKPKAQHASSDQGGTTHLAEGQQQRHHHHYRHNQEDESLVMELVEDFKYFFFERRLLFTMTFWKWAANFVALALSNTDQRRKFVNALVDESLGSLEETRHSTHLQFDFRRAGSIYVHSDKDLLHERAREGLLAGRGEVAVTPAKAKAMEPSLAPLDFVGGIYRRNDALGNCQLFCRRLAERLSSHGVAFFYGHTATDVVLDDSGRAVAVQLYDVHSGTSREVPCEHVVVSCACDSVTPLATTGLSWLPIMPVRGYTITGRANPDPIKCPTNYVLFEEPVEMAVTRLGDHIRFSSYAEITTALEPKEERLRDLRRLVDQLFPEAFDPDHPDTQEWVGRRPMTSDSLPIVSLTHVPNVFLHTGHGADGWRWSHATSRVLRDIMLGEEPRLDVRFLSLKRFWVL